MLQSSEIFVASGLLFPPSYILLGHRHDSTECEALQKLRQNHPADLSGLFNLVFPFRFLRLKCDDLKSYNRLISLESHLDLRTKQVRLLFFYML